jgi:hypothetical protein
MLTTWNIPLKISGICQYSTYSMPFIVRSGAASYRGGKQEHPVLHT